MMMSADQHTTGPPHYSYAYQDKKLNRGIEYYKNGVEIIAILLAAAWAIYTFYYEKIKTPAIAPPYLNITSTHTLEGEKDSFYLVRSTILIKNKSKIRTIVHAACFNISAIRIDPEYINDTAYAGHVKENFAAAISVPRYFEENATVINSGKIVEDEWRMDPDEEYSRSLISMLPKKGFHFLRFYAEIYASRKKQTAFYIKWVVDTSSGEIFLEPRMVEDDSLLNAKKHRSFLNTSELGRSYNMEEIVLPSFHAEAKQRKPKATALITHK